MFVALSCLAPMLPVMFCTRRGLLLPLALLAMLASGASAQETLLLRQPTMSATHIAFAHGGDLWIVDRAGGDARRLTSTPAVEADPHFSPDGADPRVHLRPLRRGRRLHRARLWRRPDAADVVPGGIPRQRLDAGRRARALRLLARDRADGLRPAVDRRGLWRAVRDAPRAVGAPTAPTAPTASASSWTASRRWDTEWRDYRGGQNTPLTILDLETLEETRAAQRAHDRHPARLARRHHLLPLRPRLDLQHLVLHARLWRPPPEDDVQRRRREVALGRPATPSSSSATGGSTPSTRPRARRARSPSPPEATSRGRPTAGRT